METTKLKALSFEALCGIIAKVIHSANRAYVDAIGGRAVNPTWEEAREEQRSGLIKAVAGMITNPQLPQTSHEQWCLAREKEGWTKDVKYDYNRKTHPNLVPYDQLPLEEKFKDHLCMGIASIFCGGWSILDMPEVQAARRILQDQWVKESEENKLEVKDDEIDPATTEALQEKLAEAKEKLAAAEAEKEAAANGEQDGELAAVKAAAGVGSGEIKDTPLPETAEDLAKDAVGANNVGEVPEDQGPKSDIPGKTIGPPKPQKSADQDSSKDTPAETEDGANDTPDADQGDKQESDSPVKTSDVQESTADVAGKSDPKGEAVQAEDQDKKVEAKPEVKKPAKKSSGK